MIVASLSETFHYLWMPLSSCVWRRRYCVITLVVTLVWRKLITDMNPVRRLVNKDKIGWNGPNRWENSSLQWQKGRCLHSEIYEKVCDHEIIHHDTKCWCRMENDEFEHGPKTLLEWMSCTQAMRPNGMLCSVVDEPVGAHYILRAGNRIDLSRRSQQISVTWIYLQVISRFSCT